MNKLTDHPHFYTLSKLAFLFSVFLILSLNIANSFLLKHGLREGEEKFNLVTMINGTADKPFVYRNTLPKLANGLVQQIDDATLEKIESKELYQKYSVNKLFNHFFPKLSPEEWAGRLPLIYIVMISAMLACIFLSVMCIYLIARHLIHDFSHSLLATLLFALLYPTTFQQGGYYYDFVEMAGLLLACYLCLKNSLVLSALAIFVFSFNKETFFLYPVALVFLLQRTWRTRLLWLVVTTVLCMVSKYVISSGYQANPGGFVEFHLLDNIKYWINPLSYIKAYDTVSPLFLNPAVQNPLISVPLVMMFVQGWKMIDAKYKWFFALSFVPNFILFFTFGFKDEFRNMSLTFPAFAIIFIYAISNLNGLFKHEPVSHHH